MPAPTDASTYSSGPFFRMADTVGDGTGTKSAIGDMTATPLYLKAAANEDLLVHRMIVLIEDGSLPGADNYGDLAAALTNGISIYKADASATKVQDITDPDTPVKSNLGWSVYTYDVAVINFGTGNDAVVVRWTFAKSGAPVRLRPGESIVVDLNDNFTGLVGHHFQFQGVRDIV